jgi:hypothetical protein
MALRRRRFSAQDIEIAVICAYFVKSILGAVPLAYRAYEMGSANCHKAVSRSFALPETLNLNDLEKRHRRRLSR